MTPKKRMPSRSTSESSSGSSSDSSSSSSSSSGSDSSSSSDSDSSTSQEAPRSSAKQQQNTETKKSAPVKSNQRKSTDSTSKTNVNKTEDKPVTKPTKQAQTKVVKSKSLIYSSEDDDQPTKTNTKAVPKRKTTAKPKNSATITPKQAQTTKPPPAKVTKPSTTSKNSKPPPKSNDTKPTKSPDKNDKKPKKKSIFSPENSSESDSPSPSKLTAMKSQAKVVPSQKPRPKASPRTVEKVKPPEKPKPVVKEEKKQNPAIKSKATISTDSSASSDSSDSSSSSDSDSSADSAVTNKTQKKSSSSSSQKKATQRPSAKVSKENAGSESEPEPGNKQVTRKLTRSASTRKSKHLVSKNAFSDTDSDTESTKRSLSRSPVKRAPVVTKGKTKNSKRNDAKRSLESTTIIEERKCPLESCDSMGHLGGKQDKHFTIEACPVYHNVTAQSCKDQYSDRKKRDENRKKALEMQKKSPRAHPTPDQKQYLQKIKEIRSKFKPEIIEPEKDAVVDKSREPDLSNIAAEYDLKLFRDAQALGSEKIEEDLKTLPYTKGTKYIEMGKFEMEVWYQSPYPEDYARLPKLYLCEYCLRYMKSRTILQRHVTKCVWRHPPGEEVYRKDKICVWEVDGKRYKQYCQNLCLLAKFFLDHKTLYYDVEPFLFYVMTIVDSEGCHTVGYFSKEKTSFLNYNVSCILTLPPYQRQGYGRLLIDFSYLLTRVENKIGSPEKPLSDLGLISYRSYWKDVLLAYLCSRPGTQLSIKDISQETAINSYDIVSTLQALGMMKYWKGKHIVLKKQDVLDEYVERMKRRGPLMKEVDRTCLRWTPFVVPQPTTV